MYLGDLMEKAESGQFSILSFLLQESQTTVKAVMEETGFSKATLTKYVTLLNDKALDSGLELTIHLEDENLRLSIGATTKGRDIRSLFLENAIKKMNPQGARIAIIHNGSPLFTGDAGSGPSEIRRYILENDLLEAIIALPNDIFYNTGIATYIWVLDNNKPADRQGNVQLIDATNFYVKMRKKLGARTRTLGRRPPPDPGELQRLRGIRLLQNPPH